MVGRPLTMISIEISCAAGVSVSGLCDSTCDIRYLCSSGGAAAFAAYDGRTRAPFAASAPGRLSPSTSYEPRIASERSGGSAGTSAAQPAQDLGPRGGVDESLLAGVEASGQRTQARVLPHLALEFDPWNEELGGKGVGLGLDLLAGS